MIRFISNIVDSQYIVSKYFKILPDSKVHGAYMGPILVLTAPDGPHVGPMNIAIRAVYNTAEANIEL